MACDSNIYITFKIRTADSDSCLYLIRNIDVKGKDFNDCFAIFYRQVKKAKYKRVEVIGINIT
jgi:hypothetical protein